MKLKIFHQFLIVLLSGLFLFSAFSKLNNPEYFEILLTKYGLIHWQYSKYLSNTLIGFELFIGVCLLFNIKLKQIILPIVFFTISAFSIFVLFQLVVNGEQENCGCFGEVISFSFKETLLKNMLTLCIAFYLFKSQTIFQIPFLSKNWILGGVLAISISTAFALNLPKISPNKSLQKTEINKPFPNLNGIASDWYKGNKIIILLSAECPHCKQLAFKYSSESAEVKDRTLLVFPKNQSKKIADFRKQQDVEKIKYSAVPIDDMMSLTKGFVPRIIYLKNGTITHIMTKQEYFEQF